MSYRAPQTHEWVNAAEDVRTLNHATGMVMTTSVNWSDVMAFVAIQNRCLLHGPALQLAVTPDGLEINSIRFTSFEAANAVLDGFESIFKKTTQEAKSCQA